MSITGDADAEGGHPTKVGVAISDLVTGLYAVIGILAGAPGAWAATGARASASTPRCSASTLAILVNQAQNGFVDRPARRTATATRTPTSSRTRRSRPRTASWPWPSARSGSGRACAPCSGRPDLAADPRFATNGDRVEHHAELRAILAERFAARPSAAWLADLEAAEIPAGAIADVVAAFDSPEAAALGMLVDVEHPALGVLRQAGIPLRFERTPGAIRSAPPLLGEHGETILGELGYDAAAIAGLRARGVV